MKETDPVSTFEHPADNYELKVGMPIPTHDQTPQFTVDDLEREFPTWRDEVTDYDDPEIVAISYARTKALRGLAVQTGLGYVIRENGGQGLEWAIDHTQLEVGQHYDSHGIANKLDPIAALDSLLRDGIDSDRHFYTVAFARQAAAAGALGADGPLATGGLIVVGEMGKPIGDGIKYVVVGEEYNSVVDLLKHRYENVTFLGWNEAATLFTKQTNEAGLTDISLDEIYQGAPPTYSNPFEHQELPSALSEASRPKEAPKPQAEYDEEDLIW